LARLDYNRKLNEMIDPDEIIYLDNNATTQLDPAVVEEMLPFLTKFHGNPSSGYSFGAQVRKAIDHARAQLASLLGCEPSDIVFTSSGTESDNAAINSALLLDPKRQHIVTTAVEHSAVLRHCEELAKSGCDVTFLPVDEEGALDLDELERAIRPETAIVSVMWANNETGVLFPIEKIAEIVHNKGVLFHTDAVQVVGKLPINLADLPINFLSLSAHKLHGPKGIGALYINRRTRFRPLLIGGGQENGRRSGTENVASIIGLGKAAECAAAAMDDEQIQVRAMRDRFESGLMEKLSDVSINGDRETRLPNTTNIAFGGTEAEAVLVMLDQRGVCCSAASACRTGSHEPSRVLRAMQVTPALARGSLRFSFSRFNSDEEVGRVLEIIPGLIGKLRALSPPSPVLT
jgi:cysteine desulfurase